MIIIYIMYYQGLTMTTCTCQACKIGPDYDNTTDQKALENRKQHIRDVLNFNPEDLVEVPVTRGNSIIDEAYAPHVRTFVPPTGTFVPPTGTFVPSTGTFIPSTGTA